MVSPMTAQILSSLLVVLLVGRTVQAQVALDGPCGPKHAGVGTHITAYLKVDAASYEECCQHCASSGPCGHITYQSQGDRNCHLKSGPMSSTYNVGGSGVCHRSSRGGKQIHMAKS